MCIYLLVNLIKYNNKQCAGYFLDDPTTMYEHTPIDPLKVDGAFFYMYCIFISSHLTSPFHFFVSVPLFIFKIIIIIIINTYVYI